MAGTLGFTGGKDFAAGLGAATVLAAGLVGTAGFAVGLPATADLAAAGRLTTLEVTFWLLAAGFVLATGAVFTGGLAAGFTAAFGLAFTGGLAAGFTTALAVDLAAGLATVFLSLETLLSTSFLLAGLLIFEDATFVNAPILALLVKDVFLLVTTFELLADTFFPVDFYDHWSFQRLKDIITAAHQSL